jgi:serine O-acetyltransferase
MGLLRADLSRYRTEAGISSANTILLQQGYWAIAEYRISRRLLILSVRAPYLKPFRKLITSYGHKIIEIVTGIHLPSTAVIGEGLFIPHFGPVIVNQSAVIGSHCTLHPGVIIGAAGRGEKRGAPQIGDRVFIGANAVIIGRISLGDDCVVGAGAVVTRPVPPRGVVVGNPAKLISNQGSFDLISYAGMDSDAERLASMQERAAALEKSADG